MPAINVKRIYEAADPKDGVRILVDRVWPRGLTKEAARIDLWLWDEGRRAQQRSRAEGVSAKPEP